MCKIKNQSTPSKKPLLGFVLLCLLVFVNVAVSAQFNAQKRYLYVQPGQSLFSVVKVLYPKQQSQWGSIIKQVVKLNPHAFINSDATKIKVGERLELPVVAGKSRPASAKPVTFKKIQAVGQVIKSRGKTFVISKKSKKRNLQLGSEIYVGDRIFTGVKGFIRLNMIDEAKIDLRCNSEMLIEDYQLLRGGNRSVIYLIKGSVKKITGTIGKIADDIYEMHTPIATVGVRGTEYAIRVLQQYGCDGSLDVNSKGLFVKVNRGAIDVTSKKKKQAMKQGDVAFLANEESKLKNIDGRDGLFGDANDGKKSNLTGSFSLFWLMFFIPIVLVLRK